jgi:hypothetical protein
MERAMGFTAVVAIGSISLAIYGILRIGIRIGVKRAIKNVVVGFLIKAQLSQVTHEGRELVAEIADHDPWYNLFGTICLGRNLVSRNAAEKIEQKT